MTLKTEISYKILQAVNTKDNHSTSDIKIKRIQDTTDQICQLVKERIENDHPDNIAQIIAELSGKKK